MKKKIYSVLFIIILLAYFFLFPGTISKETLFVPLWETDVSERTNLTLLPGKGVYPYKMGNLFGYLDENGQPVLTGRSSYDVTLSSSSYINYSNVQESLILRSTGGEILANLQTRAYPVFIKERLFLLGQDRTEVSEISREGELLWKRSFSSLISSMDSNPQHTLLGLLNGRFVLLDREGRELFSYEPGGSRLSAIYSCALSPDSTYLAAVSGIDPQRLVVLERRNEVYRAVVVFNLEQSRRRNQFLAFSQDGNFLFYEGLDRIRYFEIKGRGKGELEYQGILTGYHLPGYGEVSGISFQKEDSVGFSFFSASGGLLFTKTIPGVNPYLYAKGDLMILGADTSLLGIKVVKE